MKRLKVTTSIMAIALVALTTTSCKDAKKEHNDEDGHHSEQMDDNSHMDGAMEEDKKETEDPLEEDLRHLKVMLALSNDMRDKSVKAMLKRHHETLLRVKRHGYVEDRKTGMTFLQKQKEHVHECRRLAAIEDKAKNALKMYEGEKKKLAASLKDLRKKRKIDEIDKKNN